VLCAAFQVFKSKVLKFCHGIKVNFQKLLSTLSKLFRVTLHCLPLHVSACRPSSGVAAVGNCCTFFALLLYLIFSVQSSGAYYVFLVSRVQRKCSNFPTVATPEDG
jgi:hypothetical protein